MNNLYDSLPSVVHVIDEYTAVLNMGEQDGIQMESRFVIFKLGENIIDPRTGEDLGPLEIVRGRAEVTHLQPRMCTVRSVTKIEDGTRRKIYSDPRRRDSILFGLAVQPKTIIEEPTKKLAALDAHVGDLARSV